MLERKRAVFLNQLGTKKYVVIDISEWFNNLQRISENRDMTIENMLSRFAEFGVKVCDQIDEGQSFIIMDISKLSSDLQRISKNRETSIENTLFRFAEIGVKLCNLASKSKQAKFFMRVGDKEEEIVIP